jgi:hypothetical protein
MPFYSPSQLRSRRTAGTPAERLARQDAENQRALDRLRKEGYLDEFEDYRKPGAWDTVKRVGSNALDVLQRGEFATAGAADVLASWGTGGEVIGSAARELLSGVGDIQGEKKTIGDVVRKYNPGYDQFSEEHPFLTIAPDLAMSIVGDPTTYIGGFILRGTGWLVKGGAKLAGKTRAGKGIAKAFEPAMDVIGKTFDPAYGFKKAGVPEAYDAMMREKQFTEYLSGKYARELKPVTSWLRSNKRTTQQIDEFTRVAKGELPIEQASDEIRNLAAIHKKVFRDMGRREARVMGKGKPLLSGVAEGKTDFTPGFTMKEDYLPNKPKSYLDLAEKVGGSPSSGHGRPLNLTKKSFEKEQILDTTDKLQNFWRGEGLPEDKWGEALARSIDSRIAEGSSKIRAIRTHYRWTQEMPDVFRKLPAGTDTPWAKELLPGESLWLPRGNLLMFPQEVIAKNKVIREAIENGTDISSAALEDLQRTMVGVTTRVPVYAAPTEVVESINRMNASMGNTYDLLKFTDKYTNLWKNTAILSPGFHLRNMLSSGAQNYFAAGPTILPRYVTAMQALNPLVDDNAKILGKTAKTWRKWAEMHGVTSGSLVGQSTQKTGIPVIGAVFEANRAVGATVERVNRLALFMHEVDKGKSMGDAAATVKKWHFDYDELTDIERKVFRRVMPFYTWQRKNIPLMLETVFTQPGKFRNIAKLKRAVSGDTMSEYDPEWWKNEDVWAIRGTKLAYNAGLPYADLNTLSGNDTIGSMGPLKTAGDLLRNQDALTGAEIQKFPGERVPLITAGPLTNITVSPRIKYAIEGALPVLKRYGTDLSREISAVINGTDEESENALKIIRKFSGTGLMARTQTRQDRERIYRLMNELDNFRQYRNQEGMTNGR